MGGKSGQTIGYWYLLGILFGWCKGPIDALLEIQGGGRTAWRGAQTSTGRIQINAPELWGGEKAEGGIVSDFDVQMGEADQEPNDYLQATFGGQQSAYRGKATGVFRGGKYGAFNPYPKPMAFKLRRILKGWDNDECWLPELAGIPIGAFADFIPDSWGEPGLGVYSHGNLRFGDPAVQSANEFNEALAAFYGWDLLPADDDTEALFSWRANESGLMYSKRIENTSSNIPTTQNLIDRGWQPNQTAMVQYWVVGDLYLSVFTLGATSDPPPAPEGYDWTEGSESPFETSLGWVRLWAAPFLRFNAGQAASGLLAMNPAHILYDTITSSDGQGEPTGLINADSFTAAAAKLYSEGFGLCYHYTGQETIEQFQQYICDIIGGCLTQSRVNGQYYLDLIRDDYVLEDLPIIAEADVLEFSQEPSVLSEAVNQVLVDWFDPETRQDRTTTPAQALGLIDQFGLISETHTYRAIPYEDLANRVAARDLQAKATPLNRFTLMCTRKPYALRPGQAFRLQMPSEGIADMVCRVGSIDHGTLTDGRIRLIAVQDVFGLPDAVHLAPTPAGESPSTTPEAPAAQLAFEAPYFQLAGTLSAADLATVTDAQGFLGVVARAPASLAGLNYSLYTAPDGDAYTDRGLGDWCPTALVVEAGSRSGTSFTLSAGYLLDEVEVGDAGLWGEEWVRVTAIDADAGTLSLARGCADTPPIAHDAGERIWFASNDTANDGRTYIDGELVRAKLLTRTTGAELSIDEATALELTLDARQARPYAPGKLLVNGASYPAGPLSGSIALTWVHRDRLLQADQLLESSAAGVGPEDGTTYTVRWYVNGVLRYTETGLAGTAASPYVPANGTVRVEIDAVRDGLTSWAPLTHEFSQLTYRITEAGDRRITEAGDARTME